MAKLLVKVLQRKVVKDALSKMLGTTAAESAGKKSAMNAKSGIEGGKEVPNPFGDKADNISESEDEDDGHDQDEEDYDDDESEEEDYEEDEEEEEEKKEDGGEKEEDGKEKEVEEEEEDYD